MSLLVTNKNTEPTQDLKPIVSPESQLGLFVTTGLFLCASTSL